MDKYRPSRIHNPLLAAPIFAMIYSQVLTSNLLRAHNRITAIVIVVPLSPLPRPIRSLQEMHSPSPPNLLFSIQLQPQMRTSQLTVRAGLLPVCIVTPRKVVRPLLRVFSLLPINLHRAPRHSPRICAGRRRIRRQYQEIVLVTATPLVQLMEFMDLVIAPRVTMGFFVTILVEQEDCGQALLVLVCLVGTWMVVSVLRSVIAIVAPFVIPPMGRVGARMDSLVLVVTKFLLAVDK